MCEIKKRIHGEKIPLWQKLGMCEFPPVPCEFSIGDNVVATNDYGAKWNMVVIGFKENDSFYGRFIYLNPSGCDVECEAWWFPWHPKDLSLRNPDDVKSGIKWG